MRVLLASSEVHPYSKTGGLADMVGALSVSLAQGGARVGVVTPLYRGVRERFPALKPFDWELDLPLGSRSVQARVWTLQPRRGLTLYFIDKPEFYDRAGVYQEAGISYPDNAARYVFFSKCVVNLARYLPWRPEIVHAHDWQTGLAPLLMLHQRRWEGWADAARSCLTIHNLAYQGHFSRQEYDLTNLPLDYFHPHGVEWYGGFNALKAGIVYADLVSTVSPRYAQEILTPEFGCGLEGVLQQRKDSLRGILNGVDYTEWTTTDDKALPKPYSRADLRGKGVAKATLQAELGLPVAPAIPLFGNVGRLADQKGIDILLAALEEMLSADLQFVLLGSGEPSYEAAFTDLAARYPDKVAVRFDFDNDLSHRIEAGADFFVMPSKFEPCGLNQMYSLRYGTIPIVRATGGLQDSVVDLVENPEQADGLKFHEYSSRALAKTIRKALVLYREPELMAHFLNNAMAADFSWTRTRREYLELYGTVLG